QRYFVRCLHLHGTLHALCQVFQMQTPKVTTCTACLFPFPEIPFHTTCNRVEWYCSFSENRRNEYCLQPVDCVCQRQQTDMRFRHIFRLRRIQYNSSSSLSHSQVVESTSKS